MRIITTHDKAFNYNECKNLYDKNLSFMGNECSFDDLINNTHFYSFYEDKNLVGCVYVSNEDEKLFLNGFSIRKNHKFNMLAVKKILQFYNVDIYAKTKNKTAEFLLKRCGFEFIKTDFDGIKYYKKEK